MTEVTDLLTAIRDNPDEDTPRLMYADWLDEFGGDAARAELIRVQCELGILRRPTEVIPPIAAHGPGTYRTGTIYRFNPKDQTQLLKRERELIAQHGDRWRKRPPCENCEGKSCPICYGIDDAGELSRKFITGRITYHRGFERLEVTQLMDYVTECPDCTDGRWRNGSDGICRTCDNKKLMATAWLRAVMTRHPHMLEIVPLDRKPLPRTTPPDYREFGWCFSSSYPNSIPESLWNLLPDGNAWGIYWMMYPSREAAMTALGRALVKFSINSTKK